MHSVLLRSRPAPAEALVDRLFEAMSFFGGESPSLQGLRACLAAGASIVDRRSGTTRYDRGQWLAMVARTTWERQQKGEGFFVRPIAPLSLLRSSLGEILAHGRLELVTTSEAAVVSREEAGFSAKLCDEAGGLRITKLTFVAPRETRLRTPRWSPAHPSMR